MRPRVRSRDAAAEDALPPGYLQSLINRILNNVNVVVNNLIVKFVEDDIVLSINVKSAECYSVDHDWIRSASPRPRHFRRDAKRVLSQSPMTHSSGSRHFSQTWPKSLLSPLCWVCGKECIMPNGEFTNNKKTDLNCFFP